MRTPLASLPIASLPLAFLLVTGCELGSPTGQSAGDLAGQCGEGQTACADGTCFNANLRCDGVPQCPDGTDELFCVGGCDDTQFECSDGTCIDASQLCNGPSDCSTGEDEVNCTQRTGCPAGQFFCDGGCISERQRCDQRVDCRDGGDELGCAADLTAGGTDCPRRAPYACDEGPDACNERFDGSECLTDGEDACPLDEPFACPTGSRGNCTDDPTGRTGCNNRTRLVSDPFDPFAPSYCPFGYRVYCGGGWCAVDRDFC